jgi:hypothetical protein
VNESHIVSLPEFWSNKEKRILVSNLQGLVDVLAQLKREASGNLRDLGLTINLDSSLVIRGGHVEWRTRKTVSE